MRVYYNMNTRPRDCAIEYFTAIERSREWGYKRSNIMFALTLKSSKH